MKDVHYRSMWIRHWESDVKLCEIMGISTCKPRILNISLSSIVNTAFVSTLTWTPSLHIRLSGEPGAGVRNSRSDGQSGPGPSCSSAGRPFPRSWSVPEVHSWTRPFYEPEKTPNKRRHSEMSYEHTSLTIQWLRWWGERFQSIALIGLTL